MATEARNCVNKYEMYDEKCQAISPSKYQEIGCSASFDLHAKSAMGLRTEKSSGDFLFQNRCQSNGNSVFRRPSNHHAEAQRPGPPTPPFTPREVARPWEGPNRSVI